MTDDMIEARQKWLRECDVPTIAGAFDAGAQWQSQQAQVEPVAWMHRDGDAVMTDCSRRRLCQSSRQAYSTPLYTSPSAPAAVPEGWKLVPVEPSQEMLNTGYWPCTQGRGSKSVWGSMLAAAPAPAEPESEIERRVKRAQDALGAPLGYTVRFFTEEPDQ